MNSIVQDPKKAIEELMLSGINVKDVQQINPGINSRVYKVTDVQRNDYCLKFYKQADDNDRRERLINEVSFLTYLGRCPCKSKVPKVVMHNTPDNWSLLSWLDGKEINTLNNEDRKQIVNFISEMQHDLSSSVDYISIASEAYTSHKSVQIIMRKRANKLIAHKPKSKLEKEVRDWFQDEVVSTYSREMSNFESKRNTPAWQPRRIHLIASPSDIGIHNTIKNEGALQFIDFEYAGLDDLSKLVGDIVHQPNCPLRPIDEKKLLIEMSEQLPQAGSYWKQRYHDLKELIRLKWVFIMLNKYLNYKINPSEFQRIRSYFEYHSSD